MKECEAYGQLSVPPHDQASESLPTSGITMKECEAYGQLSVPPRASESQTNTEYETISST